MLHESHSVSTPERLQLSGNLLSAPASSAPAWPVEFPSPHQMAAPLRQAIFRTQQWLVSQQHADGYWVAELEGDSILQSEFLLLLAYLGEEHSSLAQKCARYLIEKQTTDGYWNHYPGGAIDISASVKAYFALKLTGHDPSTEYMQRARAAILANGGADAVNSFTRFYLALLGQIPYDACPNVPPEFVLLPKWFPVNLYSISAWSRTILVPLSIMSAFQPMRQIEPERGIRELFLSDPAEWPYPRCPGLKRSQRIVSWDRFFHATDRAFKFLQRHRLLPLRKLAVKSATEWMLERFKGSDGLGAIYPPMIWSIVALHSLGYADDSPEMRYCRERLAGLVIEEENTARLQPCKSPVWDTALSLRSLCDSGLDGRHPAVERGVQWLLAQEIRTRGDWAHNVKSPPGGWCFEFANAHLSRFGRHGDGFAVPARGVRPNAGSWRIVAPRFAIVSRINRSNHARCTAASDVARRYSRCDRSCGPLDAGNAKSRRRLGRVRSRQHGGISLPRAVCRSQCDDRSQLTRSGGPNIGIVGRHGKTNR